MNEKVNKRETIVVVGNGMVGLRFCEKLLEFGGANRPRIVTFCEEPRAAYDRVGLTSFFAHRDAQKLMLAKLDWYRENDIELHIGDRASEIDRSAKIVRSEKGVEIQFDKLVLATGSLPFIPPIKGIKHKGVFAYRTIEDLEHIIDYSRHCKNALVIGGGLLGLEAAKAAYDLGLNTHVVEFAPRLMPRQLDDRASHVLVNKIEELGVHVHLGKETQEIAGESCVEAVKFADETEISADLVIVSAGIRPRDDLAKQCDLETGSRGGVVVNDKLQTSDPNIFAIGEVALHNGTAYGLVAPGYEMAEITAANFCGEDRSFSGTDVSTKLKLMGIDVATLGDHNGDSDSDCVPLTFEDPTQGIFRRLMVSSDGKQLQGATLVGDASDFSTLMAYANSDEKLPCPANELLAPPSARQSESQAELPGTALVCSCNNVSKNDVCRAVKENELTTVGQIKSCTKAGTGCGGCLPLVTDILEQELAKLGKTASKTLCEHFEYSRTELFAIIKTRKYRDFESVIDACGKGDGCEICKPTVASILASLWNENVFDPVVQTLQDTNDRFMANMQRGGLYSVVPRVPGGEITPDKLIVIGEIAKHFGLYTKITGGQRIDLFGAQLHQLPMIWKRLVDAGMESGHAYGKALRTVKSCVGTTWCRYGVQDAVGFAIRVENRYKGIRAPHKVKMAVSGCIRECAEAQCKDVGLVATDNGYNLYVCGNGGAKPRHADLLIADIDEETAIKYIDRFFMYYITSADKLTRTSVWCEKLEGGIDHIRDVVVEDKLGICDELEEMMQQLVDSYHCEWKRVVDNPELQKAFRQFVNSDDNEHVIEFVDQRGQQRPADWVSDLVTIGNSDPPGSTSSTIDQESTEWVSVGSVDDFPKNGGATIKYGKVQIAVFRFEKRNEWYASQQMCPHKKAFVLSRGILGDEAGTPKIACPLHKKTFSLHDGKSLNDEQYRIDVFPVKVVGDEVLLKLPPEALLNQTHATEIGRCQATSCSPDQQSTCSANGAAGQSGNLVST